MDPDQKRWEEILATEGMPAELPRESAALLEYLEAPGAAEAVARYARDFQMRSDYNPMPGHHLGRHEPFALELSRQFKISRLDAENMIKDAMEQVDRRSRRDTDRRSRDIAA